MKYYSIGEFENKIGKTKCVYIPNVIDELPDKISKLILRPVQISEINETREKQLEEIERVFNKRCQIVSKEEAAKSMGMTANRVYKVLNELYRMRIERKSKNQNFKDTLKYNSNDIIVYVSELLD